MIRERTLVTRMTSRVTSIIFIGLVTTEVDTQKSRKHPLHLGGITEVVQ